MKFRLLDKSEIDCRVNTINEKGLTLLLYKDARVDMKLLDESTFIWKRSHELIGDRLYCTVSIYDKEIGEWVSRQDVGTESYTEKEKGQASDAFKRACTNWGIGRELYTAPLIYVAADKCNIRQKNGKFVCNNNFEVTDIEYDKSDRISKLAISCDGKPCYFFSSKKKEEKQEAKTTKEPKKELPAEQKHDEPQAQVDEKKAPANEPQLASSKTQEKLYSELKRTGYPLERVLSQFKVKAIHELPEKTAANIVKYLETLPGKQ